MDYIVGRTTQRGKLMLKIKQNKLNGPTKKRFIKIGVLPKTKIKNRHPQKMAFPPGSLSSPRAKC